MDDKGRKLEEGGQQEEKDKDARELEQENASQQEMEEVYRKSVKKKQRNMKKRQALPSCWRGEIVAPDAPVVASAAFSVPQGEENGEEQKEQQQRWAAEAVTAGGLDKLAKKVQNGDPHRKRKGNWWCCNGNPPGRPTCPWKRVTPI
jgi:hypothetical protein